jgi:hypothetical protein
MTVGRVAMATLLASMLVACAAPRPSPQLTPVAAPPGAQVAPAAGDKTIATAEGPFHASRLVVQSDIMGSKLTGSIKNNTGKLWDSVEFEVTLFDASGAKIASSPFTLRDFAPGQAKAIGLSGYERLSHSSREAPVASFDVNYKGGALATAYVFVLIKPAASSSLRFSDGAVQIAFQPTRQQIGFTIANQTSAPMKIDWNSAAYVDPGGQSHRVLHRGVTLTERANVMAPTVVPPGARVTDTVYPSDYVVDTSGRYGAWTERPLFPHAPAARALKGKRFSVLLPIEVDGKVRNYDFVFLISEVVAG